MKIIRKDHKRTITYKIVNIIRENNPKKLTIFDQISTSRIQEIQSKEESILIERGRKVQKIPSDIAATRPLRENLLSLFIYIYSKTPLFICGKPGSSKTISVNIIKDIFNSKSFNKEKPEINALNLYKSIRLMYYQGSEQSTDTGIERVFIDTQKKLEENNDFVPLVFFDEIGLAELSPFNPLKVLHKYLEYSTDDWQQKQLINSLLSEEI